ncbi:MAG: elongation factor P [bacterium]|nr:elongation factor P [bacterium]
MPSPNDIKNGSVIRYSGNLWVVVSFQRVSPGKGGSFVRTRMKDLSSGKVVENSFKASETIEFEDVSYLKMQYLFETGDVYTFMNSSNYEQVEIQATSLEDTAKYLKEGLEVTIVMHGENPISLTLPGKIEYEVVTAPPAVKGDTASGNVTKEVELENGLLVQAPIFIKQGDRISINTETGAYSERVNK